MMQARAGFYALLFIVAFVEQSSRLKLGPGSGLLVRTMRIEGSLAPDIFLIFSVK